MTTPKPNDSPREITSHLTQGFRRCIVLSGLPCPACGTRLAPSDFVRPIDGGFALCCSGCHRYLCSAEPTQNPFESLR